MRQEVKESIEMFKNPANHHKLRLHELNGRMQAYHSFSVNYRVRVIVRIVNKKAIAFVIDVGGHDVYE